MLVLLCVLCALVGSLPSVCAIAFPPNPTTYPTPRQPGNGYDARAAPSGMSFDIAAPGLTATLRYAPTFDSPSIRSDLNGVRITVPRNADLNELGGCGAPADYSPTGDDDTTLAGTILLLLGGSCSIEAQMDVVRRLGAVAWINTFKSESAELWTAYGANTPVPLSGYNASMTTPYILVSYHDGLRMANWIRDNPTVPLLATIKGAGTLDPVEAQTLRDIYHAVNDTTGLPAPGWLGNCVDGYCGYQRSFIDVVLHPEIDPCQNRVGAVWCVDGHVVAFFFKAKQALKGKNVTRVWQRISELKEISLLNPGETEVNRIDDAICDLPKLSVLSAYSHGASYMPSCFDRWPKLIFMRIDNNNYRSFPTAVFSGICPDFTYLRLATGALGTVNVGVVPGTIFSPLQTPNLAGLVLPNIGLDMNFPNLAGFQHLMSLQLQQNKLHADPTVDMALQTDYLNNLPKLTDLQLQSNNIALPLPNLHGTTALLTITLASNAFFGPIPTAWTSLAALTTLSASHNAITSPIKTLGSLLKLTSIDLSWNQLTSRSDVGGEVMGEFDTWLAQSCSYSLQKLNLARNNLTGSMTRKIILPTGLQVLDLSYNGIGDFGTQLFSLSLTQLDVSYNNMSGGLPTTAPPATLSSLYLAGNPAMRQGDLPTYLTVTTTNQVKAAGSPYICAGVTGKTFLVTIDPSLFDYRYCSCDSSYFGSVPNCIPIPDSAVIGRETFLPATPVRLDPAAFQPGTLAPITSPLELNPANLIAYAANSSLRLTDAVYGSARLLTGLNTRWLLSSRAILGTTTTRTIQIVLYINTAVFNTETDVLTVTSGDLAASSRMFDFLIRGDDTEDIAAATAEATALRATRFGAGTTAVFRAQILDIDAVVQFQSRATANQHFSADFFFSDDCPVDYEPNPSFVIGDTSPSCIPTPACDTSLVQWSVSDCDEAAGEQTVKYFYSRECLPTAAHMLPADDKLLCAYAPVAHASSSALVAIVTILCAACAGAVAHSGVSRKPLAIVRLLGEFHTPAFAGLTAVLCTYFVTIGKLSTTSCAARLHLLLGGFALMGTSLTVSLWKRRQQLELSFFNPHSKPLQRKLLSVVLGVTALNVVLIVISQQVDTASNFDLAMAMRTADGGAVLPLAVCPEPSLWVSVVLLLVNLAWLLPGLLFSVQVLWLGILSRDRLVTQLIAAKAAYKKNSSAKQKQKAAQLQSATKSAMFTVGQALSALATLLLGLAAVIGVLAVAFFALSEKPMASSIGTGVVLVATGAGMLVALLAYSLYYRRDSAVSSELRKLVAQQQSNTGSSVGSAAATEVEAQLADNEDGGKDKPEVSKSSRDSYISSTLSFSHTRGSSYSAGGYNGANQADAWAQLLGDPSSASLFDSSHTNRTAFDAVVSVVQDPVALMHLRRFAEKSFQSDSIHFIARVLGFIRARNATQSIAADQQPDGSASSSGLPVNSFGRILSDLRNLYTTHVKPGAADEINVSNEARERVKATIIDLHLTAARLLMGETIVPVTAAAAEEKDVLRFVISRPQAAAVSNDTPNEDPNSAAVAGGAIPGTVTPPQPSPVSTLPVVSAGSGWADMAPATPSNNGRVRGSPVSPSKAGGNGGLTLSLSEWSDAEFETELLRLSSGSVSVSALAHLAPASFCVSSMEVWRDTVLEMLHLVSLNTWPRFQESREAGAANAQLQFCEQFDMLNAEEQQAVMQRIRMQFGETDAPTERGNASKAAAAVTAARSGAKAQQLTINVQK